MKPIFERVSIFYWHLPFLPPLLSRAGRIYLFFPLFLPLCLPSGRRGWFYYEREKKERGKRHRASHHPSLGAMKTKLHVVSKLVGGDALKLRTCSKVGLEAHRDI